ncbi:MAG: hypothetical protein R3E31_14035 [Chloroflexota bacterium]
MFKAIETRPGELRRVTTITHERPLHEVKLAVMGEPLLVQTNDEALLAAAVDTFGRFPAPPPDREPLVIQVLVRGSARADEPAPAAHPRLRVHNQRHLVYLSVGEGNTAVADIHAGFAFAMLDPVLAQDVSFVRHTFIESMPKNNVIRNTQ